MREFINRLAGAGFDVKRAALISDNEPEKISSPHLQAHSDERRLFCEAAASAAKACAIKSKVLVQEEIAGETKRSIGVRAARIAQWLASIGEAAGRPWRSDEKSAAIAAWIAYKR